MSNPTRSRKTKGVQPRLLHAAVMAQMLYESELSACKQAKACDPDCEMCMGHESWAEVPSRVRTYYRIAARNFVRRLRHNSEVRRGGE